MIVGTNLFVNADEASARQSHHSHQYWAVTHQWLFPSLNGFHFQLEQTEAAKTINQYCFYTASPAHASFALQTYI